MAVNIPEVTAYIRQAAMKRGIDPEIAVRVARSEGLAPGVWQSNVVKNGKRETSYGPFQLLVGGGLGDQFVKQTGMDPRDPSSVYAQVDFALDNAAQGGWSPWYGAAKVGVGNWDGVKGAKPAGVTAKPVQLSPEAQSFVTNNPQPGGFGPGISDPNALPAPSSPMQPFGSMAPVIAGDLPGYVERSLPGHKRKTLGDRLSAASKAWDEQLPKPPRISPMGDARDSGNALLKVLNSPTAAEIFLAKRLRGVA